jgi:predicted DNA binding CopG/RHH family protein
MGDAFIQCRVTPEIKLALRTLAHSRQLTESAILKRMLEQLLSASAPALGVASAEHTGRPARLYVRLRPDDRQLLSERARARGLPAATFVSTLLRAYLRHLTPVPAAEVRELLRAAGELAAVGRLLNLIIRAQQQGYAIAGINAEHLGAIQKACEELQTHMKAYIRRNTESWISGDA